MFVLALISNVSSQNRLLKIQYDKMSQSECASPDADDHLNLGSCKPLHWLVNSAHLAIQGNRTKFWIQVLHGARLRALGRVRVHG